MATEFPNSYKDDTYASLDAKTEQKLGLPSGLLASVRTNGERSNHDQTNDLKTATVYQFIPATRKAILDKYGIDVTLNPQNASEGAGLLLKEGLDRNKGDAAQAVGEYVGGLDRKNWGKTTQAYIQRVTGGLPAPVPSSDMPGKPAPGQSTFDRVSSAMDKPEPAAMATVLKAYQSGQMSPEDAKTFEQSVNDGHVMLPRGVSLKSAGAASAPAMPDALAKAYMSGSMEPADKAQLDDLIKQGVVAAPKGASQIPGQTEGAPSNVSQKEAPPTLGQQVVGAGEAALNLGTGLVSGAAAPVVGLANALTTPDASQGSLQGASNAAEQFAQNNTYAPRTAAGQTQAAAIGNVMANAVPLMGMHGEMASAGQAANALKPTTQVMAGAIPSVARDVTATAAQNVATGVANRFRAAPEAAPAAIEASPAAPIAAAEVPTPSTATPPLMTPEALTQTAKGAAAKGVDSTHAATLAGQAAPDSATVAAAKRLGVEDYLQPDHVSTNQAYREWSQAVKSIPTSEARAAEVAGLQKIGERAEKLISDIGGSTDLSQTSANVRTTLDAAHEKYGAQAGKLYDEVNRQVPKTMTAEPANTLGFLKQQATDVGGADRLLPPEKKLLSALSGEDNRPVTYAYLDQQRKQIGQAIGKASGPFADSDVGLLKKLYSTLSDDQSKVVESVSPEALNTYKAAQTATKMQKGIQDDMSSLFGKQLDQSLAANLRGSVSALAQGDAAKIAKLMASVPESMRQEVAASGIATAFRTAQTNGPISFTQYAKWYEGLLRNKQAHAAIMANLPPAARKSLSDLYRVSKGISNASRERITTGRIQAFTQGMNSGADTLAGKVFEAAKEHAVAAGAGTVAGTLFGPGIGAAVGSALAKGPKTKAIVAADALIASPEFAQLAKTGPAPPPAAVQKLARSSAFRRYAKAVGDKAIMKNPEQWIMNVLHGSAIGGAGNTHQ